MHSVDGDGDGRGRKGGRSRGRDESRSLAVRMVARCADEHDSKMSEMEPQWKIWPGLGPWA